MWYIDLQIDALLGSWTQATAIRHHANMHFDLYNFSALSTMSSF